MFCTGVNSPRFFMLSFLVNYKQTPAQPLFSWAHLPRSREGVPTLAEKTRDCVTVNCHVLSLSYPAPPFIYRGAEDVCGDSLLVGLQTFSVFRKPNCRYLLLKKY